ncbi:MAG: hypothetical protein CMQ45_11235 [Gammaproteobacteria bacterium]|nr:hypothetical protein [Gammaproteobacteria bacterium]
MMDVKGLIFLLSLTRGALMIVSHSAICNRGLTDVHPKARFNQERITRLLFNLEISDHSPLAGWGIERTQFSIHLGHVTIEFRYLRRSGNPSGLKRFDCKRELRLRVPVSIWKS